MYFNFYIYYFPGSYREEDSLMERFHRGWSHELRSGRARVAISIKRHGTKTGKKKRNLGEKQKRTNLNFAREKPAENTV
jgi:hypothetical protein